MPRHDGFAMSEIDALTAERLRESARRARGSVLTMTSLAASGHPGGSFSSMEMLVLLYAFAHIDPEMPRLPERDRIVVSHGHVSPGVYAVLAENGFFPREDVVAHFRQAGSPFEGHVERTVPGVEWSTGNLGQGLSAGVGLALASRMSGLGWHTYVAMSDGEQQKGQVGEARRLAVKQGLVDLTCVVDLNGIQISGRTRDVLPVDVAADFSADGWGVIECDGHDVDALYSAMRQACRDRDKPFVVIAHTIIGKGVSFMEGREEFHGRGLTAEEYMRAMAELGLEPELERFRGLRDTSPVTSGIESTDLAPDVVVGDPVVYGVDTVTDNRSAWGRALVGLAEKNPDVPMAVMDCDLAVSVKTDGFKMVRPEGFIQCGVGEHNAATVAGALSTTGVLTFWADFGVFGVDEVYNQHRLNDINVANLKLVLTHCGLDVGEDGKTHQCLDYVGAFRNLFGWKVIVPADPNQTDRAVRAAAVMRGNVALAMGRSKIPVITALDGAPLFASEAPFEYGRATSARTGGDGCILTMGTVAGNCVAASDRLRDEGSHVAVTIVSSPLLLDDQAMRSALAAPWVLVVEDHNWRSGLWASVAEWCAMNGAHPSRIASAAVRDYSGSGASAALMTTAGLDVESIMLQARGLSHA